MVKIKNKRKKYKKLLTEKIVDENKKYANLERELLRYKNFVDLEPYKIDKQEELNSEIKREKEKYILSQETYFTHIKDELIELIKKYSLSYK